MDPRSVLPLALLGGWKMQVAEPLLARGVPVSLAPASVPAHAIRVGRTGPPAAVTRTAATRADPAFGRTGVSFTVLAVTDVEVPPPLEPPTDVGATSTVTAAELFARLSSGADVFVISAFMT